MTTEYPSSRLVCICCGKPTRQRCPECKRPLHNQAQYTGDTLCKSDHYMKYHHPPNGLGTIPMFKGGEEWN